MLTPLNIPDIIYKVKEDQDKSKQRVTLFLDPELVLKAKMQGLHERISLSKLVDKAISQYLLEPDIVKALSKKKSSQ